LGENVLGLWAFKVFLGFRVQRRPGTKLRPEGTSYVGLFTTTFSVISFLLSGRGGKVKTRKKNDKNI